MNASMDSFRENGFHGTKMTEISKVADVSSATLYKHFDSKDQLFGACLELLHCKFANGKTNNKHALQFLQDVARVELSRIDMGSGYANASKTMLTFSSTKLEEPPVAVSPRGEEKTSAT